MQIRPYSSLLWLRPFVALLRNGAMQGRRSSHVFPGRCGARARPPQWMSCRPRYGKGISANESRSQCPPLVCLKSCLNLAWKEALARVNLAPTKAPGAGRWPLAAGRWPLRCFSLLSVPQSHQLQMNFCYYFQLGGYNALDYSVLEPGPLSE